MENRVCNHDPKYLVKRVRKRIYDNVSPGPVPEKLNILAIAAGLIDVDDIPSLSTSDITDMQQNTKAANIIDENIVTASSPATSTYKDDEVIVISDDDNNDHDYDDDDEVICLTETISKPNEEVESTVPQALNNIDDVIQLDSDDAEEDNARNLAKLSIHQNDYPCSFSDVSPIIENADKPTSSNDTSVSDASSKESSPISANEEPVAAASTSADAIAAVSRIDPVDQNTNNERNVIHDSRSKNELLKMPLEEHKDYLSFYVAQRKNEMLRGFEILDKLSPTDINSTKSFTILSYNVLSQSRIVRNRPLFPLIDVIPDIFEWKYRSQLLAMDLNKFGADICCLQEVERGFVEIFYEPFMATKLGYASFYAWRNDVDGCGIFWKPDKFDEIQKTIVPLNFNVANLNKSNVAQILSLKHKKTEKEIIIVNTQLTSDPNSSVEKLHQLTVIFAHVQKARTKDQPIIFCGDFNFGSNSLLYKFITDGELNCLKEKCFASSMDGNRKTRQENRIESFSIPEASGISNECTFIENDDEKVASCTKIGHSLNFESVYGKTTANGRNVISTFHHKINQDTWIYNCGNPDFIFYSVKQKIVSNNHQQIVTERNLFLHKRLSLPDEESLEDLVEYTPHNYTGSDHLPLFAHFFLS